MSSSALTIAQVSPFALETPTEVGHYVQRSACVLAERGHRVLVLAPSQSSERVRESRRLLREDPETLLARAGGAPLVLAVGEVVPFGSGRRRAPSLPVDVARTIEEALAALPLDVVHVHEPFAPSASSAALRTSHALNVATFHAPSERILSTQLGRPLSQMLFARLDARLAGLRATRELLERFFPGAYELLGPAVDPVPRSIGDAGGPVELVLVAEEERAALRTFLRALRALPLDAEWRATIVSNRPLAAPATLSRALRERVRVLDGDAATVEEALGRADVLALASEGALPRPELLARALASGIVPVATRLPVYDELLSDGVRGLEFEPGDVETLAAQLTRLIEDPGLRAGIGEATPEQFAFTRLADRLEEIYGRLVARRHDGRGKPALRRALAGRPLIDVDLHMHTDHSGDCATPVEVLLAQARARGLGAIAVTDHNEISGALEARAKANGGIKVIVGEEVKTAEQGEVIGLFIEEKIPRGMSLEETIAEIRRQGGIVYVPHPFDRMHSVPDYGNLLGVLDDVDAIEIFNPRVAISEFNEEAVRFAAKYRIPAGAGSDAHVPQGLGSVRIRMRDFDGPEEFLESLRDADIVRNPASLLYVQALKFLETKALPPGARRARRDRRVRRVARKP